MYNNDRKGNEGGKALISREHIQQVHTRDWRGALVWRKRVERDVPSVDDDDDTYTCVYNTRTSHTHAQPHVCAAAQREHALIVLWIAAKPPALRVRRERDNAPRVPRRSQQVIFRAEKERRREREREREMVLCVYVWNTRLFGRGMRVSAVLRCAGVPTATYYIARRLCGNCYGWWRREK